MQQLAAKFEARIGNTEHLYFVDAPYGLQFYLNTMKQRISYERAARLLNGSETVFVALRSMEALKKCLPPNASLHMVIRWPEAGSGFVFLVSNRAIRVLNPLAAPGCGNCFRGEMQKAQFDEFGSWRRCATICHRAGIQRKRQYRPTCFRDPRCAGRSRHL